MHRLFFQCINCAACSYFAPNIFTRSKTSQHHIVYQQPPTNNTSPDFINARNALAACPVSAIRTLTKAEISHYNKINQNKNDNDPQQRQKLLPQLTTEEERMTKEYGILNKPLSFPKQLSHNIWLLGHHSSKTFGAFPYLVQGMHKDNNISVMVDVPKCTSLSKKAVSSLLELEPPTKDKESECNTNHSLPSSLLEKTTNPSLDYLFLTHVDDTAHHNEWKNEYPNVKRIFHSNDLGEHNWIGDISLEHVEILLNGTSVVIPYDEKREKLICYSLDGEQFSIDLEDDRNLDSILIDLMQKINSDFLIMHTPGHSLGSISLLYHSGRRQDYHYFDGGTIFTGDSYAFTTRNGGYMTGFPRYGYDLEMQAATLKCIGHISKLYDCVASGHGHIRNYRVLGSDSSMVEDGLHKLKNKDISDAINELLEFSGSVISR